VREDKRTYQEVRELIMVGENSMKEEGEKATKRIKETLF
jgi:hypothetical protein